MLLRVWDSTEFEESHTEAIERVHSAEATCSESQTRDVMQLL